MGRLGTQRVRPTRLPGRSGPLDRTAGGIGGAAPASLDLYGHSRTEGKTYLEGLDVERMYMHGVIYLIFLDGADILG
jgi:hypothetical protein